MTAPKVYPELYLNSTVRIDAAEAVSVTGRVCFRIQTTSIPADFVRDLQRARQKNLVDTQAKEIVGIC